MISISNITKKFGNLTVLKGINFDLDRGGIFAVLGPNGSGKTTILKIILGMVIPQSGEVMIDGKVVNKSWGHRKGIGYLPQIARFPDNLTVNELISMIKDIRQMPAEEKVLIEKFGMEPFLNQKLSNLSGGTRQKVNIILTFMFDSPILILDEPTAGLDPLSLVRLKELIQQEKEKGKIILITTHILNLVESLADEIIFLLEGDIYFKGSVQELTKKTGMNDLEHSIARILE
ncbi:MAG: ABC transporter ATP-binding protein [bacterium]|nr:ABC transporter ATP-binding protein [bacterium]